MVISDKVPLNTNYQSCSGAPCSASGGVVTWQLGSVPNNANGTVSFTVLVKGSLPAGSVINNDNYGIVSDQTNLVSGAPVSTSVNMLADTVIYKSVVPNPVAAGGILTYTLSFANQGPSIAESITITDVLPTEATFIGVISQPAYLTGPVQAGQKLTWTTPSLLAGDTGAIVYKVLVDLNASGTIENMTGIRSTTADLDLENNHDIVFTLIGSPNLATIYGWVYKDANSNDVKDLGEKGIPNVVITLDGSRTTTTLADGLFYFFTDVVGKHIIVETDPTGYFSTTPNEVHVFVNLGNKYQVEFGDAQDTSDFATIYGTVFDDLDQDGIWDGSEYGIPGVTLTLDSVTTVASNEYGSYTFRLNTGGNHRVVETDPTGYVSTTPNNVLINAQLGHGYKADYGDMALCTCPPDEYENDDSVANAKPILVGLLGLQEHTFCDNASDWLSFTAKAGNIYTITTDSYGKRADTFLVIYDTDGHTLLAANDDYRGGLDYSSRVVFEASKSGIYYINVTNRAGLSCCQTNYRVWVVEQAQINFTYFLPIINKNNQHTFNGIKNSALAVPDGVIYHMCPDTYEVDDTWEQAHSIVPGDLQVHSFDSNPALYAADKDVLGFDVRANDLITFTVVTVTNTQTLLELYDENGNALNITGTTQLAWQVPEKGHYYLSVSPLVQTFGCSLVVGYQLRMDRYAPPWIYLPIITR